MRILVTGSRDWVRWNVINDALNGYGNCWDLTIVHGDCPTGADRMAQKWCDYQLGGRSERHPADWSTYGRAAGPIRNQQMVDLGADVCLAFPMGESHGTRNCMRLAQAAGIPVVNYGDDAQPSEQREDVA